MSDADESDTGQDVTWRDTLIDCLNSIQTTGDFSWADTFDVFVNPGLEMNGHGQIPLPLCSRDAETIKQSGRLAPFGMVDKTVVDESVRKTWELDQSQFRLGNPRWQAFLEEDLLAPAAEQLGLVGASVKLHKLLLYEPGSFFKLHKDSQKEDGMVGTLVVCLPSEHEGADVRLSFKGKEHRHATGPTSKYDLTALAWFSDVSHEVEQLSSGYRLVLTYNIVVSTSSQGPSASFFDAQTEKLQRILADWKQTDHSIYKFYYPLEHQYSESGMTSGTLKGRDAAVCHLLHQTASAAGFCVFLASMTHTKTRDPDDDYENEDETAINKMYTFSGHLVAQNMRVDPEEIPYSQLTYGDDDAADSEEESKHLGNQESPAYFRYHDTVVVLWEKSRLDSLLGLGNGNVFVDRLISEASHDFRNRDDQYSRACITRFLKACDRNWQAPRSVLPRIVEWGIELDDEALYDAALEVGSLVGSVQLTVARLIKEELSKHPGTGVLGAEEKVRAEGWDRWLGIVVKSTGSLTTLRDILCRFESELKGTPPVEASFRTWKDVTLMKKFETKTHLEEIDGGFVVDVMIARHEDDKWLATSLLPDLCGRGTRPFLRKIVDSVYKKEEFSTDEKRAILKHILQNVQSYFLPHSQELGKYFYSGEWSAFAKLLDQCLSLRLTDPVCRILEETRRNLQGAQFRDKVEGKIVDFLNELAQKMEKQNGAGLEVPLTSALKPFVETLLRIVLRAAPVYPEERFKGWAMPAKGCGDSACTDCQELKRFVLAEDEKLARFQKSYNRAKHMRYLYQYGSSPIRSEMAKAQGDSIAGEDAWVLAVTKVKTMFQQDLEEFEKKAEAMRKLLKPLEVEYVRKLLGDDGYRELVLLEGIRPRPISGDGETKRSLEDEPDEAKKRARHNA